MGVPAAIANHMPDYESKTRNLETKNLRLAPLAFIHNSKAVCFRQIFRCLLDGSTYVLSCFFEFTFSLLSISKVPLEASPGNIRRLGIAGPNLVQNGTYPCGFPGSSPNRLHPYIRMLRTVAFKVARAYSCGVIGKFKIQTKC